MSKVITFGSLNMDLTIQCQRLPQGGETVAGSDLILNPGGKGGNQAVAAARAGAESQMIACVGDDIFGQEMLHALAGYGVQCSQVRTASGTASGMAFIIRHDNDNRIILNAGANEILEPQAVREALEKLAQPGDLFLTQFECNMDTTFDVICQAHAMGLYTVVNPAPAKEIPPEVFSCIDLLVLNQSEAEFLSGIPAYGLTNLRRALDFFQSKGVSDVIITLGGDGSILRQGSQEHALPACPVEVVDTTAAGDTYIGALAAHLCRGNTMEDSARVATYAASLSLGKCGAHQSIPSLEEITAFMKEDYPC